MNHVIDVESFSYFLYRNFIDDLEFLHFFRTVEGLFAFPTGLRIAEIPPFHEVKFIDLEVQVKRS